MNDQLSCPYSTDGIFLAVKQIHPMKASSPDGLPPLFFQKYWGLLVMTLCRWFNMFFIGWDPN